MEELHSLDPRRQELLEARFTGAVTGNTVGSTGSTSGGAKVTAARKTTSAGAASAPGTSAALPGSASALAASRLINTQAALNGWVLF